ncbi:hypothetical protein ACSLVK_10310 [Photorhabdus tasmaniensis]
MKVVIEHLQNIQLTHIEALAYRGYAPRYIMNKAGRSRRSSDSTL